MWQRDIQLPLHTALQTSTKQAKDMAGSTTE